MSVSAQLCVIPNAVAQNLLVDADLKVFDLMLEDDSQTFTLDGYWHGLHYVLTGTSAVVPGDAMEGQAIITHHKLPLSEADFWIVTAKEVPDVAQSLENVDRRMLELRYEDLAEGEVQVNMQSVYSIEQTRSRLFALLDGLVVFYRQAAEADSAVLISIN